MPNKNLLTYQQLHKILPKEDILDMVFYEIITPVAKTNLPTQWRFKREDITTDLYSKLNAKREEHYIIRVNDLLAKEIENEWNKKR